MSDLDTQDLRQEGRLEVQRSLQKRGYYHQGMSEPDGPSHAFVVVYADGAIRAGGMSAVRAQMEDVLAYGEDEKVSQILVNLDGEMKPVQLRANGEVSESGHRYVDLYAGETHLGGFSIFVDF